MTTYGQYFNPQKPDNRLRAIFLMILFLILSLIYLSGCNSVRKSTDIKISKRDSSSINKVDSTSKIESEVNSVENALKIWDKGTNIIFYPGYDIPGQLRIKGDSIGEDLKRLYPKGENALIIINGDEIFVSGPIKSFTTGSKGKDSTYSFKSIKKDSETDLKKESKTEVKSIEKEKSSQKDSHRSSPVMWLAIACALISAVFLYFLFRKK